MTKNSKKISNVSHIENLYTKEQMEIFQQQRKQIIFKRRRMAVILGVACMIFSFAGYHLIQDYQELATLATQQTKATKEKQKVAAQKSELQYQVTLLHDDGYVQKLIRSRYLYSKEGEKVYQFPQAEENSGEEATTVDQPITSVDK